MAFESWHYTDRRRSNLVIEKRRIDKKLIDDEMPRFLWTSNQTKIHDTTSYYYFVGFLVRRNVRSHPRYSL